MKSFKDFSTIRPKVLEEGTLWGGAIKRKPEAYVEPFLNMWKDPNTSNEWKRSNLELTRNRLNGWQQEAWDKSYAYKIDTGLSLIKKKLLQQKK